MSKPFGSLMVLPDFTISIILPSSALMTFCISYFISPSENRMNFTPKSSNFFCLISSFKKASSLLWDYAVNFNSQHKFFAIKIDNIIVNATLPVEIKAPKLVVF